MLIRQYFIVLVIVVKYGLAILSTWSSANTSIEYVDCTMSVLDNKLHLKRLKALLS